MKKELKERFNKIVKIFIEDYETRNEAIRDINDGKPVSVSPCHIGNLYDAQKPNATIRKYNVHTDGTGVHYVLNPKYVETEVGHADTDQLLLEIAERERLEAEQNENH